MDPFEAFQSVLGSLSLIPAALFAIVLLAGPTAIWLGYRFVVQPRTKRYTGRDAELLWACEQCHSANAARASSCYRCGLRRDEIVGDLLVIDGDGVVTLAADVEDEPWEDEFETDLLPGLPVMTPTRPAATPRAVAEPPRRIVAVGPGRRPDDSADPAPVLAEPATAMAASTSVARALRARQAEAADRARDEAIGARSSRA